MLGLALPTYGKDIGALLRETLVAAPEGREQGPMMALRTKNVGCSTCKRGRPTGLTKAPPSVNVSTYSGVKFEALDSLESRTALL